MKIKSSSDKFNRLVLLAVFLVSVVAAIILRFVEVQKLIDPETGFFATDSIIIPVFYGLIVVASLFFVFASYVSKECNEIYVTKIKSKKFFVETLIFAAATFFDGALSVVNSLDAFSSSGNVYGVSPFKGLMVSGALPLMLRGIFAFLAGVFFIMLSYSGKNGDGSIARHRIFALMPVAWVGFRLIGLFVRKISFIKVSDLLLEIVMCSFMILFFMALAENVSGIYSDESRWKLAAYGLPAALIACALSCTRLGRSIFNHDMLVEGHPFYAADFFFVFFMLEAVFSVKSKKNIEEEPKAIETSSDGEVE